MPAQFTSTSTTPNASATSATARATSSPERTSHPTAIAEPASRAMASATVWAPATSTSSSATAAPSVARRVAIAAPIPDAAPVISACLPPRPRSTPRLGLGDGDLVGHGAERTAVIRKGQGSAELSSVNGVSTHATAAQIRQRLDHPVIDVDGHLQELSLFLRDDVMDRAREIGGARLADRVARAALTYDDAPAGRWFAMPEADRRDEWVSVGAWWAMPTNARDRAAAYLPGLLHERLDELG